MILSPHKHTHTKYCHRGLTAYLVWSEWNCGQTTAAKTNTHTNAIGRSQKNCMINMERAQLSATFNQIVLWPSIDSWTIACGASMGNISIDSIACIGGIDFPSFNLMQFY